MKQDLRRIMAITTTRKATPAKAKTRKKPTSAAASVAPRAAPKKAAGLANPPKLVHVAEQIAPQPDLKKKELIDLVVERSNIKKKDAKPVVEAMLAVLGETIASGRELNLQPLGKLRINRSTDKGNGRVIICKLRQSLGTASGPKDALAQAPDKL
jgi:DNA-binding protein